ncbi:hypothetical protein ACRRTK_012625 [Alexandromys fortis]
MLWTSSMRAAIALRSMSGVSRSGYEPPHSWKMASEAPASSYAKRKNPDSDADMDVDGGDTLEQGKPQFTETDVIPCTGEEPGEPRRERHSGAVLIGGPPSTRITPEFSKWASDERPSPSDGRSKQEAMQKPCKDSDIEKITEDSAVTTPEARVRELEQQLSRGFGAGGGNKCLICMDLYFTPQRRSSVGMCTVKNAGCGLWVPRSSALSAIPSQCLETCAGST